MSPSLPAFAAASSFAPRLPASLRAPQVCAVSRTTPRATSTAPAASSARTAGGSGGGTAFRKYHGLGNDFILIDNRDASDPLLSAADAVTLCDRHRGVGADGVIFLLPARTPGADCAMRLYNSDGTEPEMCGNGIRCLARFAADVGHAPRTPGRLVVDTLAGPIVPELRDADICVDMGPPVLSAADIPTTLAVADSGAAEYEADGRAWAVTPVSMGNPHAVIFVDDATRQRMDAALESVGPEFETHPAFPQRTNTEFVVMKSPTECDMLVWERGAGRTMACGTGACAVAVAAVLTGRAQRDSPVTVHLPGGDLVIEWRSDTDHVLMTGPAELVYEGKLANL